MTDMDEMITFVRARLDEDERVALEADADRNSPWHYSGLGTSLAKIKDVRGYTVVHVEGGAPGPAVAKHIARNDPKTVLAKIAAERAILHAHGQPHECIALTGSGEHSVVDGQRWELWEPRSTEDHGPCLVVRLLAQPYGGRDGWRQEWAVERGS